jgi:hypothetical protein
MSNHVVTVARAPRGKGPRGRQARELKRLRSDARAQARRTRQATLDWVRT